jgi:hypothetical protein
MPYWSARYKAFIPSDIPGLVSWYDSNSIVACNDGRVTLWNDKYIYRNDLISYLGAISRGNTASNLLPNSGSINLNNTFGDLIFSNAVMTSSRGALEFQYETSGTTIFVCGDFQTRINQRQNYVSVFTRNYSNPTTHNNNLTVGTMNRGNIFDSNFINIYDLSNTTTHPTNLTPIIVGWFDPNRNISNLVGGFVGTWSNLNPAFLNQNLITGNNCNSTTSNTITVLSNNLWTGTAAREYGCNAANVLNFPYAAGYTSNAGGHANNVPQLSARVTTDGNASFIRAIGFVVSYSSNTSNNSPDHLANTISATHVTWTNNGAYFRNPFITNQLRVNRIPNISDLMFSSNAPTVDGIYGGGLWINSSNVWDPAAVISGGYGNFSELYDMRENGLNIVFIRLGEVRRTGIGISGQGGLTAPQSDIRGFYGQIGDIIALGSNYTTDDQHAVEGYLAQKYNILGKLRNNHPYKNGYNGIYPFGPPLNSIVTGIAFNNCNTVSGYYTSGYFNGRPVSKNSNLNIITTDRANFNMFVGDSCNYTAKDGSSHNINTGISEVLVYNSPLSEYDIGRVHKYLQEKHNSPSLHNNGNFSYL